MVSSKTLAIVFLFLFGLPAQSQQRRIEGRVLDAQSKQPLPEASVTITGLQDTTLRLSGRTNTKGVYSLQLVRAGSIRVKIGYVGYSSVSVDTVVSEETVAMPDVFLPLADAQLAAVVVSAAKPYLVIGVDKITINVQQSAIAAGGTIYDALRRTPGMMEQNEQFSFRGRSLSVFINGRPSHLSGEELKSFLQNLPAATVEKIEVLTSPSAKYNADGGAVVNIVLAKDKSLGTTYNIGGTASAGRQLSGNGSLDITNRGKKVYGYLGYSLAAGSQYYTNSAARYLTSAVLESAESERRTRTNHFYKGGIDYDLTSRVTVGASYTGFFNLRGRKVENRSGIVSAEDNPFDTSQLTVTQGTARFTRSAANLYGRVQLDSAGNELVVNLDHLSYQKQWDDYFTNRSLDVRLKEYRPATYIRDRSPADITVRSAALDLTHPLRHGRLEAGGKFYSTRSDNDIVWENSTDGAGWLIDRGKTNRFIYTEQVSAAYLTYVHQQGKWQWQTGLRMEKTVADGYSPTLQQNDRKSFTDYFPNASVQFTGKPNSQFGLSYRKSITRFGFSYVNPFVIYQSPYAYSKGNPELLPELYHNIELSYTYRQAYSAALSYVKGLRTLGEVYLQGPANTLISSYGNYSSSTLVFLSVSGSQAIGRNWQMSLNPMVGAVSMNNSALGVDRTYNGAVWAGQVQFSSLYRFKNGIQTEFSCMYITPFRYGAYTRRPQFNSDIGISTGIFRKQISLKIAVSDVLNTVNSNRQIAYDQVRSNVRFKAESRFVSLTARYKFGNKNVKTRNRMESKIGDVQSRTN